MYQRASLEPQFQIPTSSSPKPSPASIRPYPLRCPAPPPESLTLLRGGPAHFSALAMTENPGAKAASAQVWSRVALGNLTNVAAAGGRLGAPDAVRTVWFLHYVIYRVPCANQFSCADRLLTGLVRPAFEHDTEVQCGIRSVSGRATALRD